MKAQVINGTLWKAKKVDNTYILSINDKANLLDAFADFVTVNKIPAGSIIGLAAINEATLRFFDPTTKKYIDKTFKEQMEMSNLTGNISTKDGKPYLHIHVTLGRRDYSALAGHLQDAKIRGAGEFIVTPINSDVERTFSDEVGLNFYDFEKSAN
ncbi:DNA-binding protein [Rhizosphaericola mali]|uniref:DNA-binding protein n=2 Tax=Rhizosphaericola mali TaxID=2545455 RepID=A0A5P2G5V2_9BACT|nr:DNA-binding protein [Rhizosphaericola mali]